MPDMLISPSPTWDTTGPPRPSVVVSITLCTLPGPSWLALGRGPRVRTSWSWLRGAAPVVASQLAEAGVRAVHRPGGREVALARSSQVVLQVHEADVGDPVGVGPVQVDHVDHA